MDLYIKNIHAYVKKHKAGLPTFMRNSGEKLFCSPSLVLEL